MSQDWCREQQRVALALFRGRAGRDAREHFIRLALHWRALARAQDITLANAA